PSTAPGRRARRRGPRPARAGGACRDPASGARARGRSPAARRSPARPRRWSPTEDRPRGSRPPPGPAGRETRGVHLAGEELERLTGDAPVLEGRERGIHRRIDAQGGQCPVEERLVPVLGEGPSEGV